MLQPGISVIICCYNSSRRIVETLQHLALQEVPVNTHWEIILVNNASTDNTSIVAENAWATFNQPGISFKIVDEPNPGLSNAREKGIQHAKYDYIVYCDDDTWFDKNYINAAFEIIANNNKIAAVGGQSTPVADIAIPAWFYAAEKHYAVGQQAAATGDITTRKHLWGSGLVFQKSLYLKAYANFPSILSGRKGKELNSGEDSEMCMRFIIMGYRLYYSEKLRFRHFIAIERLNEEYNNKLLEGFVKADEVLDIYKNFIDVTFLPFQKKCLLFIKSLVKTLIISITSLKKWDFEKNKDLIYIICGYRFNTTPNYLISIKHLERFGKTIA